MKAKLIIHFTKDGNLGSFKVDGDFSMHPILSTEDGIFRADSITGMEVDCMPKLVRPLTIKGKRYILRKKENEL